MKSPRAAYVNDFTQHRLARTMHVFLADFTQTTSSIINIFFAKRTYPWEQRAATYGVRPLYVSLLLWLEATAISKRGLREVGTADRDSLGCST